MNKSITQAVILAGGHCIPIDPFYFTWKARELGMNTRFIELAGEINTKMPEYVFRKVNEALNQISKSVNGSDILILGLGYKKNIDDTRESPSFAIIDLLLKSGANIKYSDPFLDKIPKTRKYSFDFTSIKLDKKNIASFDLIILATDHDEFDYDKIEKYGQIIVDTRGRFKNGPKIVRA